MKNLTLLIMMLCFTAVASQPSMAHEQDHAFIIDELVKISRLVSELQRENQEQNLRLEVLTFSTCVENQRRFKQLTFAEAMDKCQAIQKELDK